MPGTTVYPAGRTAPGVLPHPVGPREWIDRARSSLALARSTGRGVRVEDLCPLARQAVERALCAVLVGEGLTPPPVPGVAPLLAALIGAGIPVPERLGRAAVLFGGEEPAEPVRIEKYYEAIMVASEAIRFAEERVGRH
ncbi:MAG TPA: HEPN domain-containing protein [Methanoregulaceae archaeon]|nr:HEPN domain-containing protein [Methanoregulaceae archaeon]